MTKHKPSAKTDARPTPSTASAVTPIPPVHDGATASARELGHSASKALAEYERLSALVRDAKVTASRKLYAHDEERRRLATSLSLEHDDLMRAKGKAFAEYQRLLALANSAEDAEITATAVV